jgi:hypothetical protein
MVFIKREKKEKKFGWPLKEFDFSVDGFVLKRRVR